MVVRHDASNPFGPRPINRDACQVRSSGNYRTIVEGVTRKSINRVCRFVGLSKLLKLTSTASTVVMCRCVSLANHPCVSTAYANLMSCQLWHAPCSFVPWRAILPRILPGVISECISMKDFVRRGGRYSFFLPSSRSRCLGADEHRPQLRRRLPNVRLPPSSNKISPRIANESPHW